jgi:hypothetical protein
MTPADVGALAIQSIHEMEATAGAVERPPKILSMTATTSEGVERLEPAVGDWANPPAGVRWLVRAEGTFIANRYPGGKPPPTGEAGFFVVDDASRRVDAFGMHQPTVEED